MSKNDIFKEEPCRSCINRMTWENPDNGLVEYYCGLDKCDRDPNFDNEVQISNF